MSHYLGWDCGVGASHIAYAPVREWKGKSHYQYPRQGQGRVAGKLRASCITDAGVKGEAGWGQPRRGCGAGGKSYTDGSFGEGMLNIRRNNAGDKDLVQARAPEAFIWAH